MSAWKQGASDYIEKPFAAMEVIDRAVERAFERADLLGQNRRYRESLEQLNSELRRTLSLLTDDADAARKVQARMLPRNRQRFGPFEFTREVVPAAYLSGDFIDAFAIDDHRWAFYLADVAGHGVSSALVTVLLRTFVQRHAAEHARMGRRPGSARAVRAARLLDQFNEEMCTNDLEKHVTIFYGVVDSKGSTLLYANAGHFPWPLLFDGERVVEIEQSGVPAGLLRSTRYAVSTRPTSPRDLVLAVFSDGLLEILPHADLMGKQAFLRALFGRAEVTVELGQEGISGSTSRFSPTTWRCCSCKRGRTVMGSSTATARAFRGHVDDMTVLKLTGPIRFVAAQALRCFVDDLQSADPDDCVLVDVRGVDVIDSTGMGVLARIGRTSLERRGAPRGHRLSRRTTSPRPSARLHSTRSS